MKSVRCVTQHMYVLNDSKRNKTRLDVRGTFPWETNKPELVQFILSDWIHFLGILCFPNARWPWSIPQTPCLWLTSSAHITGTLTAGCDLLGCECVHVCTCLCHGTHGDVRVRSWGLNLHWQCWWKSTFICSAVWVTSPQNVFKWED